MAGGDIHTLESAHCALNCLPSMVKPSSAILSQASCASSRIAKETYPTPFDVPVPGSRTTNADRTGAKSEKSVFKSVDVAVYGKLETNSVDLQAGGVISAVLSRCYSTHPYITIGLSSLSLSLRFPSAVVIADMEGMLRGSLGDSKVIFEQQKMKGHK